MSKEDEYTRKLKRLEDSLESLIQKHNGLVQKVIEVAEAIDVINNMAFGLAGEKPDKLDS